MLRSAKLKALFCHSNNLNRLISYKTYSTCVWYTVRQALYHKFNKCLMKSVPGRDSDYVLGVLKWIAMKIIASFIAMLTSSGKLSVTTQSLGSLVQ